MVAHVHGRIDQYKEHPNEQLVVTGKQLRVGTHQQGKGLTMRKLVITPLEEPLKDGVETALWVTLKMAVNRDVARIPNFFRQVGRIKNEFRPKVGVFLVAL